MSETLVEPLRQATAATSELAALMEVAVDAIIIIDGGGRILSCNPAAERMFGYPAAELTGQPVEQLMPEPYRSEHASYLENYRRTGQAQVIGTGRLFDAVRQNGEVFPALIVVGESETEAGTRYVGIVRDLTGQRQAELEYRALELGRAQVGRWSLLGEMAAGIAHELNQPLAAIANFSQAASHSLERGEAGRETLGVACAGIAEQVQRAGDMIQNLRRFLRRVEVARERLNLNSLIESVIVLVTADASFAGVRVEVEYADDLPDVMGSIVQLQQVLLNLTHNAVDAMRETVGRPKEIRIETRRDGDDGVLFEVSDRGSGVPPKLAEAIFHPFFTTRQDGLGMGLAISRSIVVEAHGGTLRYEDRPNGGSRFVVRLPAWSGHD